MNYQASRLATEKADFRPALTPRSIDGAFTEKRMKPATCKSCDGDQSELRQRHLGNGSIQIVYQCLTCGRSACNPIAKSAVRGWDELPMWDESLADRYDNQRDVERLEKQSDWFKDYQAYLQTKKWRQKHDAVMERAGGLCEGCRAARAVQVHHLTYAHVKNEFLWELVAVCKACHDRFHEPREANGHGYAG
jgi:5-methylcytosine-specific restriction endonuclease McrA